MRQSRNQIRSTKSEIRMTEIQNALYVGVLVIRISCFEFVSDFEIRISNMRTRRANVTK